MNRLTLIDVPVPANWSIAYPEPSFDAGQDVLGSAGAGPLFPSEEGDLGRLVMDLSAIGLPTTPNSFALRVEGDSMINAGISDGDIILLERREAKSGDIVVAVVEGQVTVKRYVIENGRHILRPANPKYEDRELTGDWILQAVAVGLIRKF